MGGGRDATAAAEAAPGPISLNAEERELVRSLILADPDLVLGDDQVIRALIGGGEDAGRQVVDLRDRLVARLEGRLRKLMQANRSMIAAAYETVAGTRTLHRALLALLDADGLEAFFDRLTGTVPAMLGIEAARLLLEADVDETGALLGLTPALGERVLASPEGTVDGYLMLDGAAPGTRVHLRTAGSEAEFLYGSGTPVRSEALVRLDLDGAGGLLAFGAAEIEHFAPDQGTDNLVFFGAVTERLLLAHLRAAEEGS
ncbi:MAG: DUF484 family protein [Paracoccaceae bacterium]